MYGHAGYRIRATMHAYDCSMYMVPRMCAYVYMVRIRVRVLHVYFGVNGLRRVVGRRTLFIRISSLCSVPLRILVNTCVRMHVRARLRDLTTWRVLPKEPTPLWLTCFHFAWKATNVKKLQ